MIERRLAWVPLLALALVAPTVTQSQTPPRVARPVPDPVMLRASAVRDRFVAAIERCGVKPTYLPSVAADTPADGIDYDDGEHSVHVSRWKKLPPPVQQAMQGWAQQGTLGLDAPGMWGEIFNEFLVAHELGHYLESMSGKMATLDNWQSEIDADRIALAFWSIEPADAARLPQREQNYTRFLLALPSPVPAGADPRSYFAAHYEALAQDLGAYGWFQGQVMKIAWEQRGHLAFCDWVKANPPLRP